MRYDIAIKRLPKGTGKNEVLRKISKYVTNDHINLQNS